MVSFVVILSLSVLPSFASAERVNIIAGKFVKDTSLSGSSETINLNGTYDVEGFYLRGKNRYSSAGNLTIVMYNSKKEVLYTSYDYKFPYVGSNESGDVYTLDVKVKGVSFIEYKGTVRLFDFEVYGGKYVPQITNLKYEPSMNSIFFNWENPVDASFNGVKIYKDNELVATVDKTLKSYTVSNLEAEKSYKFKVVSLYDDKEVVIDEKDIKTLLDPSKIPPSNVTNLKVSDIKSESVKLSWINPSDKDLKGLRIFNGDKLISETGIVDNFLVKDLKPNTSYEFKVVAIDNDGNLSGTSTVRFTTLEYTDTEPPESPKGLAVKQGSEALFLTWKNNTEKDLAGYNVYLDGKKVNSSLVDNPFFTLRSLKNDADYKVQVSAVDKSGNESTLSSVVVGKPVSSGLPIIGTDYSLNDVTLGISEFFGSFWLIIAFAVSIPLSFYIAARVKLLFLD